MQLIRQTHFSRGERVKKPSEPKLVVEPLEDRSMFNAPAPLEAPAVEAEETSPAEHRSAYTFFLQVDHSTQPSVNRDNMVTGGFHPLAVALLQSGDSDVVTGICVDQPVLATKMALKQAVNNDGGRSLHRHDFESYAGRPPNAQPVAAPPSDGRNVLLIEDDPTSQRAMEAILKRRGWHVISASTLAEGMAKLSEHPDSVIVDLMLPDGDGEKLVRKIRDTHMPVRVTVVTGVTEPDRLERIKQLHPESLLTKPVNVAELLRELGTGPAH